MNSSSMNEAINGLTKLEGFVKVEQPNNKLNTFNGNIKLKGFPTAVKIG